MASVTKVARGWRARYRTPDGGSRSRTFARRVDAEQFLTATEHSKLTAAYVDPGAGRVTFGAYAEQWRTAQVQHRPTTRLQVETNLRRHVLPTFGHRSIASIRPSEIQGWVKVLAETLEPATVQLVYRYVVAVFRAAVADRVIATSPTGGVNLPRIEHPAVIPLDVGQVHALMAALPERYRVTVTVAAGSGLRHGEVLGLLVDRVDFLRRTLRVDQQLTTVPGRAPYLAPPKTAASIRTIPLPHVVVDALAAHLAAYPVTSAGYVFTNERGDPIRRTAWSPMWQTAVRRAGLPAGTRFHDLRHFYASALIGSGCSVKVVQSRLGHASASETLDVYSHLWPDDEDKTRRAIDDVLGVSCHTRVTDLSG